MARCVLSEKKVIKYAKETKLPVLVAWVRGGTNHRIDLGLDDGSIVMWWRKENRMEKLEKIRWNIEGWKDKNKSK